MTPTSDLETVATRAEPAGEAELLLTAVDDLAALAALAASPAWQADVVARGGFGLLLVWADAPGGTGEPDFAQVAALARSLIEAGLFYLGAAGPGSARVEYAVDVTDVTLQLDAGSGDDAPMVMTTAFAADELADALFELWEMAPRDDGKPWGPARVVVLLGPDPGGRAAAAVRALRPASAG